MDDVYFVASPLISRQIAPTNIDNTIWIFTILIDGFSNAPNRQILQLSITNNPVCPVQFCGPDGWRRIIIVHEKQQQQNKHQQPLLPPTSSLSTLTLPGFSKSGDDAEEVEGKDEASQHGTDDDFGGRHGHRRFLGTRLNACRGAPGEWRE